MTTAETLRSIADTFTKTEEDLARERAKHNEARGALFDMMTALMEAGREDLIPKSAKDYTRGRAL